jgi:hypothetical protein
MRAEDGSDIVDGCAPYSIAQAGGIHIDRVLHVCIRHGFASEGLTSEVASTLVAQELGLRMTGGRVNLKIRLKDMRHLLSPDCNYIIETKEHWLPAVQGEVRYDEGAGSLSVVLAYWKVENLARWTVGCPTGFEQ